MKDMAEEGTIIGSPGGTAIAPVPQIPRLNHTLPGARAQQRITTLGEMTVGIAHDFRNILAMIGSGLSLAERSQARGEAFDAYLLAAREGVERGARLTARLLAFAKPQRPHRGARDINDLIRELAVFVRYSAGPGNRIVLDLAEKLPLCRVDPSSFSAALLNLVVNARDAMPERGEIRISTHAFQPEARGSLRADGFVLMRVSDTGEGMSAETVDRIFDPFFTTKGDTGTGLGVPQVQAFMQFVGGQVQVRSKPGVGTTFDLLFPAADNDGEVPTCLWRQVELWINEDSAAVPRLAKPGIGELISTST